MTFDADTALELLKPNTYRAGITDHWDSLGGHPNGGYLLAVAVRALSHELPHPDPVAVSAVYPRRGSHGPADVETRLLKTGRRLSFGAATLSQAEGEVMRVHAAFGDLGATQTDEELIFATSEPPDLPSPEECLDLLDGQPSAVLLPGVTIADRLEYRLPRLPGWRLGKPTGDPSSELWLRLRDGTPPCVLSLPLLVDAMAPVLLELNRSSTTVELTTYVRARPRPGWLSCRITTKTVAHGLHEEDLELWDSGGTLVAQSRQLGLVLPSA